MSELSEIEFEKHPCLLCEGRVIKAFATYPGDFHYEGKPSKPIYHCIDCGDEWDCVELQYKQKE